VSVLEMIHNTLLFHKQDFGWRHWCVPITEYISLFNNILR